MKETGDVPVRELLASDRGKEGHSFQWWLRALLVIAAALVVTGWVMYVAAHGGERLDFGESLAPVDESVAARLARALRHPDGISVMLVGIVVLVLTPMARVAAALARFARERDRVFVLLSAVVLLILVYGLFLSR